MAIRVVIADDTDLMRATITQLLKREPKIEVVGEARNFAETLERTTTLKPDVLLLDLHMPDEKEYPPETVKNHVLQSTGCVLAISIWNDEAAKSLAQRLGAKALLDKVKMSAELIAAVFLFCAPHGKN